MKTLLVALLATLALSFAPVTFGAPVLVWDPVTTDSTGASLEPGMEVTSYKVYRCGASLAGCATKTLVGTVAAPATQIDLAGESFPMVYVATAVNKVGESANSVAIKLTPTDVPKNLRVQ